MRPMPDSDLPALCDHCIIAKRAFAREARLSFLTFSINDSEFEFHLLSEKSGRAIRCISRYRVGYRTDRITAEELYLMLRTVDLTPDCSARELCSRAQLPRTPVVADSGRAAYAAALSLQRMDLHLTEFQ
jgi:hypothetical protein